MKKFLLPCALAAAAVVVVAGCSSDHGAYVPENTMTRDLENRANFVLLDDRVQHSVSCSGIEERFLSDGRLEVTANVRNRESRRIEVQIDCVFKDEHGFSIEGGEAPFQTLIMTENAQESVKFTSLNTKAKRYTVRVRQAYGH
jgi:uncharacterized protein YcfL